MKRALALSMLLAACGSSKPKPVIASFETSAATIDEGGSTFLRFDVKGADDLSIDQGVGPVKYKTSAQVAPVLTTTYTLTARNDGGSTTATLTITVVPLPATLTSFTATPDSAKSGGDVTLAWTAAHTTSLVLTDSPPSGETLPALAAGDTQVVVHPRRSTVYTLTATGRGAKQPAPMSAIVAVGGLPLVELSAAQASVARGSTVALSWTSSITASFTLVATPHGGTATRTALGTLRQTSVRPTADTDYSIEALAAGGTATSNSVAVSVTGALASSLSTVAPAPGSGDVVALQGSVAGDVVLLDLVTVQPISASALALELPLDGNAAGSRDGSARVVLDAQASGDLSPGFTVDVTALDPGHAPAAAIAALPSAGPSAGILVLAVAQKPSCAACAGGIGADATLPAGTHLARIRLKLVPAAGAGPIFAAASLDAAHGFRSVVKNAAGSVVGTVAVGSLSAL